MANNINLLLNLDKEFGMGTAEELLIKANEVVKISTKELESLITYYKNQIDLLNKIAYICIVLLSLLSCFEKRGKLIFIPFFVLLKKLFIFVK